MRFFALLLLISYHLYATPVNKCVNIDKFSDDQKEIIAYAYNYLYEDAAEARRGFSCEPQPADGRSALGG